MRHFMVLAWDINESKIHGPYELEKVAEDIATELAEEGKENNVSTAYFPVDLTIVSQA